MGVSHSVWPNSASNRRWARLSCSGSKSKKTELERTLPRIAGAIAVLEDLEAESQAGNG
jgi:hypothetical protein